MKKSVAYISIIAILLMCGAWDLPNRETLRKQAQAVKTPSPPTIDGVLNDAVWQKSPVFEFAYTIGTAGTPRQYTKGWVLYDNQNLYVAIKCQETELELLRKNKTERDAAVWEDDYIEVFIDHDLDRKTFYQIIVNPIGTVYDQNSALEKGEKWNGDIKVKTEIGLDYWTVEMAISWKSLGIETGKRNIGFNMNRYRVTRPSGGYQDTCWSPLRSWKSATPEMFGVLNDIAVE